MPPEDILRALFGRSRRVLLMAWIAAREADTFYQSEPASDVGDTPKAIADELEKLVELGLVQKVDRVNANERQYYVRLPSPWWELFLKAREIYESERPSARSQEQPNT